MSQQELQVRGMTCNHCVNAVKEEIGALEGVQAVEVVLDPEGASTVTVSADAPLATEALRSALIEAGDYELV